MENKEINSHFIQKAMAKRWATDNKVSYIIHGTKEGGSFNIKNYKKQPIAIKGFYTEEIEKGMNTLEVEGDRVIKKVLLENSEIILTRKEVNAIKFYYILTSLRTKLARMNLKKVNINDDESYIKKIKSLNESSKEFQELQMKLIFEKYNNYKKDEILVFTNIKKELEIIMQKVFLDNKEETDETKIVDNLFEACPIELIAKDYMNILLESKLIFVKFNEGELFLTETNGFVEKWDPTSLEVKYTFFPISPNMGILFIPDILVWETNNHLMPKSKFFDFNLNEKNQVIYQNKDKITELKKKDLKKFKALDNIEIEQECLLDYEKKLDFFTNNDLFSFPIHFEKEETLIMCNIAALSECNDSYVIYNSIYNYYNALQWIKKLE